MSEAVAEYLAMQNSKFAGSDPRIVELWKEQQEIERMKKILEEREEKFLDDLKEFAQYADKNFRVTDMRKTRVLDMPRLKQHFHDVWEQAKPSDKYVLDMLKENVGCDQLYAMVRAYDPEKYDAERKITLVEFDKLTGDSSAKEKYLGVVYNHSFTAMKKSRIESLYVPEMMKFGNLHKPAALEDPEDDE